VQGARVGFERTVMLGEDLVLPGSLVRDARLDYVALGHIHKPQDLNENGYPAVIYPGSIERVDFGEVKDEKFFIVANVARSSTKVEWRQLREVRPFVDKYLRLESSEGIGQQLCAALPGLASLEGAIVRLTVEYPRDWEPLIDDAALREITAQCFEFQLVKRPQIDGRIRLPEDQNVGSYTPLELLDLYWKSNHTDEAEAQALAGLAAEIIESINGESSDL
jgi:exonuclease SbcD